MDFLKFVDIINRNKLFFPTADRLGDPFEGSYPKAYIDYFNSNIDKIFIPSTWDIIDRDKAPKQFKSARKYARKIVAISCWNMQHEESAALWKIYTNTIGGIAIQTTIGKLKESLKKEIRDIHIGKVEYIDYYSDFPSNQLTGDYVLKVFLYKGKSYEFESEVRMIIRLPELKKDKEGNYKIISKHEGYEVTINPEILIDNIYVSPTCEKWEKNNVLSGINRSPFW